MFCNYCGSQNPIDASFCSTCGKGISSSPSKDEPSQDSVPQPVGAANRVTPTPDLDRVEVVSQTYEKMLDGEVLRLSSELDTLSPEGRLALTAQIKKRGLDRQDIPDDKTVTTPVPLEARSSAAHVEPQVKSAKWLYAELGVMLPIFAFSLMVNVFLLVSDSFFPLDKKPSVPNAIVVVGMLIGMSALWKAILKREPKTNDLFKKKHRRFVFVVGLAFAVLFSAAALWGYKNGNDRMNVSRVEVLMSDLSAAGQVATRVDEIRSRDLKTTQDYVDAYSELEAPLTEWKSKVDKSSSELEEIRSLNLSGTVPMMFALSQTLDLAKQRIVLIEKMAASAKEMGTLPSDSQVVYWNRSFKPLLVEDDELLAEATKMQQKLKDSGGNTVH
jgi:hypothetical protein